MTSREATIALNILSGIGPVRVRKLVDALGSAEEILSASQHVLERVEGIGPKTARIITEWESSVDLVGEIDSAKARGIHVLTQEDEMYPEPLLKMYDAPLVLYVWGELATTDHHGIAMVGSRKHTYYGQQSARQLSFQLANAGVSIISGLARGIDTFAHEGAIAAKGRTVAVIGSGLGQLYPPENMSIAETIADGRGAVISEFPLETQPSKTTFPLRNRIVAGLSTGVVVIECPKWSGSRITANLAADLGKTVYAVPGPIDSPTSAGCHDLIRNGATLVTSAEDILSDKEVLPLFEVPMKTTEMAVNPALLNLSETEQSLYDVLSSQPVLMDQILDQVPLSFPEVSVYLLQLELKKLIRQLPGQRYVRVGNEG